MSDCFYTSLTIGGRLPVVALPEFVKVLSEQGVSIGSAGDEERHITEETVRQNLRPGEPLFLFDYQAVWGRLELIENFCQDHALTYQQQIEPRYEWSGLEVNWQPGWEKPTEVETNREGSPIVPLDYLKQRRNEGWTLERIIEEVEKDRVTVPPFEIVA